MIQPPKRQASRLESSVNTHPGPPTRLFYQPGNCSPTPPDPSLSSSASASVSVATPPPLSPANETLDSRLVDDLPSSGLSRMPLLEYSYRSWRSRSDGRGASGVVVLRTAD